jgi:transposase
MAHKATTQETWYPNEATLYVAFEVSKESWRVLCSAGGRKKQSGKMKPGCELELKAILERARSKLGLAEDVRVLSCLEAGRDGFWPHRFLTEQGLENLVVDASSMKVSRQGRRPKTDRIDVGRLLADLVQHDRGGDDVWRVVHVPSREDELDRYVHRELEHLKKERNQHRNRVRAILATEGVQLTGDLMKALAKLEQLRTWRGESLPQTMLWRLERKRARLELVEAHMKEIEQYQVEWVKRRATAKLEKIAKLETLRGIGVRSAWVLVMESLGWRQFRNRKEVGGSVGLGGTPYDSGQSGREQGISKAANARVRSTLVELSWLWIRYQPESNITKWFEARYGGQGKRAKRIGIVGVARRLMIQLWHFVEHDVEPPGAIIVRS